MKAKDDEEVKQREEEESRRVCKRKSQMFARLDFSYCSTDCVKRHQRELMGAAAAARFNK
eukprot:scaffold4912_cov284-Chaetoceros_neogracile.AAC.1